MRLHFPAECTSASKTSGSISASRPLTKRTTGTCCPGHLHSSHASLQDKTYTSETFCTPSNLHACCPTFRRLSDPVYDVTLGSHGSGMPILSCTVISICLYCLEHVDHLSICLEHLETPSVDHRQLMHLAGRQGHQGAGTVSTDTSHPPHMPEHTTGMEPFEAVFSAQQTCMVSCELWGFGMDLSRASR